MASTINLGYCLWLDGETFNALLGRTMHIGATWFNTGPPNQVRGGVIPGSGEFTVTPGSGMNINVAAGNCLVPNTSGSTQGGYLLSMMSSGSLSVAASDPTNPRIDLVCATVSDVGSSSSFAEVQIITGTPAASPAAPALPASSITLYQVTVPATATSILTGNIASTLAWTVPAGGIMPAWGTGTLPAGYAGAYAHDRSTGRLLHNSSSGVAQPHLLPFQGVTSSSTSAINILTSGESSVLTASVTTDGSTDIEITISWPGIYSGSASPFRMTMRIYIDATQVGAFYLGSEYGDGNSRSGGSGVYFTSGALGTTPSMGTHTVKWAAIAFTTNGAIFGASYAPMQLRVKPVCK